ncbi:conserved Plasmodium protein, unknown function [Plasmodium gallinaceum]|uniref:Rad21/Rec8-like protein N-terminal domain-containing protein n=1 Tax=Plasmodium gallinaceum TaxID=5849 RepID=A0A1J1GQQ7_PLAGA|nr:conserved Plasmodium protein, unknown function [Plasmodium gallinaceum]CRG94596.1 conserved Plasmodium protein, unknown function [Plasmodium gallinaceum]
MEVLKKPEALKTRIKRSRSIIEREETNLENNYNNHNNQIIIYGNSFKNNVLSYAWNAYFDKNKIKKNIMVCCDLSKICDEILRGVENNSLTLKTFSFLLIGVCNIYKKKVYFVSQDYDFLKRKIISLYKNKDENVSEFISNKDSKRKKGSKDDDEQNKNKKRLNRTSLNIKRGSIGMNELLPSVINDFAKRKSRFSLNADEISISGTQQNTYNDFFNENEMNNQMLMDISGLNYLSFNDHDMEKPLDGSYISRNSIPMNNFERFNLNRQLSESFNPMDNLNAQNSLLNNMIPKNMFSNLENSFNEKSMSEYNNNLELNSLHKSDMLSPINIYNNLENNYSNDNANVTNNNYINEYANMNNLNSPDYKNDKEYPFNIMSNQENSNGYENIINNNQNMNVNFNGTNTPKDFHNFHHIPINNFIGGINNMNNTINNRNDLYNLNPFISMNSLNNLETRNNFHFSHGINNYGDVDASSNIAGSIFSPQKKKNISKKNGYSNFLNFETYQNFDYFDQKDDYAFIKKLNSLLGLDESEDDKKNKNNTDNNENDKNNDENDMNKLIIQDEENSKNFLNSINNNNDKNNQILLNEYDNKNEQIVLRGNENQIMKKRKLEKHIIDKNYILKDSIIKGMMKDERVDYKYFLIDTINNEINEKIQKEFPEFQYFSIQTTDKIKPVYKLEINFGYESLDYNKKKTLFENHLSYLLHNKLVLYENKNVLEHFNIKKCLDNIDEHMVHNENDTLSNNFLSFQENDGTMKSDMNFEEVREEFNDIQFETQNMNANDYKNRFSIDPLLSQNEQIDLNLNDLNFKDDVDSKINLESQMSKSLVINRESSIDKSDDLNNLNFVNEKINSEFNSSPLDLSLSSNYDFSNIFNKENGSSISSIIDDNNLEINVNLNQDFDLITKELLEVYKNLSKKINYVFFDVITKNRKSKSEISTLFYITLHLANLGYINIMQKPILSEHLENYEENLSRPILIQFIDKKKDN